MRQPIERSAEAMRDLDGLIEYFRAASIELAQRFVESSESTFQFLARNREVGQLCLFADPELADMRVWPIERFRNHLVFFRPTDVGVHIVRVLHGARDVEALFSVRAL